MLNVQPALAQLNNNIMNQNPNLHLELELNEVNVILACLQELPAKVCNPLSEKIKQQAIPQIEALNTPEAPETSEAAE